MVYFIDIIHSKQEDIKMARSRRTKRDVLNDKISKIDAQIALLQGKMLKLQDEQDTYNAQLKELEEAEKAAKQEADLKELLKAMKKSGKTVDEIKEFLKG